MIASIDSTSEEFTFVVILKHLQVSAPGVTRTPDPRIRNPLLYPAELRAHNSRDLYRVSRRIKASERVNSHSGVASLVHERCGSSIAVWADEKLAAFSDSNRRFASFVEY